MALMFLAGRRGLSVFAWIQKYLQTITCCSLATYDGRLMSPLCSTLSAARKSGDGGPQPLRSAEGPGRYGLKGLRPAEKEKVRVGNVLALSARKTADVSHDMHKPWDLEQPHHDEESGKTSMLTLDEFVELKSKPGVCKYTFDQCMFGAVWEKSADLLSNLVGLDRFNVKCNHPKHPWTIPWSGRMFWSAHPLLKGRQMAIPSQAWGAHML